MRVRNGLMALVVVAAMTATTLLASAQSTLTLYQGAQINGRLRQSIDSGTAHVGDSFVMDVVPPYPSGDPTYQGAIVAGVVSSVSPAGQGHKASIGLQCNYLRLADGSTVNISANVTSDQPQQQQKNGGHVALTTIGGMILGNIIGKSILHTNIGGAAGAAGGLLYGLNKQSNLTLPSGSNIQITLNQTVTVRRQSGP